jgi:hypothetical protein
MSVLVEPIVRPCPETEGDDSDAERTREWLVSNGLGGVRLGDRLRRPHPALPRPARRRVTHSARPDDDAGPAQRAPRPARRLVRPDRRRGARRPADPRRQRPPYQVPPRGRAPSLALRGRRSHPGEAAPPAPPPERGLPHLPTHRGGRCGLAGGVLPWCQTRFDGTVIGAPYCRTPTCRRRCASEDVARRHSAPRAPQGSGATIPGTLGRPGQTDTRARGFN